LAAAVSRFDPSSHPEFKTTPPDRAASPRRVKFNHAQHLAAGMTLESGGAPFTFAQVAAKDRARYGWGAGQSLDRSVLLGCADCHQLDGADQLLAVGVAKRAANRVLPRSSGATMLPITYDRHCAACHPLAFDPKVPDLKVPHGQAPADVIGWLRQFYAASAITADQALLRQFVPPRPLPDQSADAKQQRLEDAIGAKVLTAAKRLFSSGIDEATRRQQKLPQGRGGCIECHTLKAGAPQLVRPQDLGAVDIEPVLMTTVWLESAYFNHTAHRALDCTACHAGVSSSRENGDHPLLPGITVCASCHSAPAGGQSGRLPAASAACTECHHYHNGDHPERGPGAASRRATAELSIEQFRAGTAGRR